MYKIILNKVYREKIYILNMKKGIIVFSGVMWYVE